MKKTLIGVAIALVFLVSWGVGVYNGFVGMDQEVKTAWAQVETQYQRRYDLIPNLVEATKSVLKQEQTLITAVTEARTQYGGAKSTEEKMEAAGAMDSALSRLLVVMENYPELKSDETVKNLMDELAGTENRIAVERKRYNETVSKYNVAVKTLPKSLIAGVCGFKEKEFFEATGGAEVAPKIEMGL